MPNYLSRVIAMILLVFTASGCTWDGTPEIGSVSGVVLKNGEPLPEVLVEFQPRKGRTSLGVTNYEGKFELFYSATMKGAAVEVHDIYFTLPSDESERPPRGDVLAELEDVQPGPDNPPERIRWSTPLKVRDGKNTFVFDLDDTWQTFP